VWSFLPIELNLHAQYLKRKAPGIRLGRHRGLVFIELKTVLRLGFGLFFYLRLKRFFNNLLELADIFTGKFSILDTFTIHAEHL
jgi:hypothetical protein